MTFAEFHDWFIEADARLAGQPPKLALWWELKARLDAVTGHAPGPAPPRSPPLDAPAAVEPTALPSPSPEIVDDVDDLPPTGLTVYEQALETLRKPGRASRPRP